MKKPKPAPIQQFIEQLRAREAAAPSLLDLDAVVVDAANKAINVAAVEIRSGTAGLPAPFTTAPAGVQASEIQPSFVDDPSIPMEIQFHQDAQPIAFPSHWSKGALLNVRNRGTDYCITLYPEEFDPRHPERSMTFPNSWTCQDFVSRWYARENPDPRAR